MALMITYRSPHRPASLARPGETAYGLTILASRTPAPSPTALDSPHTTLVLAFAGRSTRLTIPASTPVPF